MSTERPRVAIFRELLLAGSETFIRNQVDALTTWEGVLFGLDLVDSPIASSADVPVMPGASRNRRRLLKITRSSRTLRKTLMEIDPSLVHAHFGMDAVMLVPTLRKLGLPLVVTFHGVDVNVLPHQNDPLSRLYRARLQELFSYASALVTNSSFMAARLESLGAPPDRIHTVPIGIPLPAPVSETQPRQGVIFLGRLADVKGVDDGLRAYARLPQDLRDAHPLTIAGDGPMRTYLEKLDFELGAGAQFVGAISPTDAARLLSSSAVFLGPSKTAANGAVEAFGMVFLEAAAAGIPSVAYRCGGVPEAVLHERTGLLAEEGDVAALSTNLERLLGDSPFAHLLGCQGREHVQKRFDIQRCTQVLETLYDSIAHRNRQ
ncbi:glycosyltransferase [Arthrobacter sp. Y-9]|uniref:glycosyltransferase n=1 Tax=Arthrobacter sp. Y-9 TaxID=3039385 RepID=UPI00241C4BA7|nr:glycosyltransferase [Arthrobacter sp. Y-9]WFR84723.1 glycosyltransferase [Arthrobacter sp. Y-9]